MPNTWIKALNSYSYKVKLSDFLLVQDMSPFFGLCINGDHASTIAFENRFRENALREISVYFEVIYWKLYSQANRRNACTINVINHTHENNTTSEILWKAIAAFVETPCLHNLKHMRLLFGFTAPVIAVCLTFPAFLSPCEFPMVDKHVALWVNEHYQEFNKTDALISLTPFIYNHNSLQDNDFENYLNWMFWCRHTAKVLSSETGNSWRARDVEMAVFSAHKNGIELNLVGMSR